MAYHITLSVHDIVDEIYRKGHLDTRIFNQSSMLEGTRLHALYQNMQQDGYLSEYPLSYTFYTSDFIYHVNGKADGVLIDHGNEITVEEIKTTVADLDQFIYDHGQWHLSQAMFYAYMIAKEKNVDHVVVLMTYIRQQNSQIRKQIRQLYTLDELSRFVDDTLLRYTNYQKKLQQFKNERNESIEHLHFPFPEYRKGQDEMISFVSKTAQNHDIAFIEAPTGIGKTVSVLYPLVERFKDGNQDHVFYLTSKNAIKKVAMSALFMFQEQGVKCKSIEFTSQENICFNDKKGHCNPDECPFAKNYYDKLLNAKFDALAQEDTYSRKTIEDFCYQNQMCPFQFQFDLGMHCDVLVCDYSYIYDYHDHLKFKENDSLLTSSLCVDECHNLPERVRDMYSTELEIKKLQEGLTYCGRKELSSIKQALKDILSIIASYTVDSDDELVQKENLQIITHFDLDLLDAVHEFLSAFKAALLKHPSFIDENFLELYYDLNSFYYLATFLEEEEYRPSFLTYFRIYDKKEIQSIRITNLNSRSIIKSREKDLSSIIYFSATLSPKEYYIDLLGGDINSSNTLFLSSPFDFENRRVFIDSRLSLRYKDRKQTLPQVYQLCLSAIKNKKGNYFIFCPSFEYLESLADLFSYDTTFTSRLILQGRGMSENQREDFLNQFKAEPDETVIGLMVLGGVFSEGIDLSGERLIGAIIISAGIPQINFERDRIKDYYDDEQGENKGFDYAYTYPGFNKIIQAGGRVIRSETDKGFLLYIDSRFHHSLYLKLLKDIYPDAIRVISPSQVSTQLKLFWKKKNEL